MADRTPLFQNSGVIEEMPSGDTVSVESGGTGLDTYDVGDLLYADGATSLAKLADVAPGNVLLSGGVGVAPSYGKVTSAHVDSSVYTTSNQPDHGGLGGLTDDDHSQYALLAGRSGGQTLIGGTDSGDDLTLQSTSHATKGSILLGAAGSSAYDEVNNRVGVGTPSPSATIHSLSTTEQLRLGYDATYYRSTTIASNGTGINAAIIQGGAGGTYQNAFEFSATNTNTASSSVLRTIHVASPTQTTAAYTTSAYGIEVEDQGDATTTGTGIVIRDQTVSGFGTAYGLVNYGNSLFAKQITSSLSTGTSPFSVSSTTVNTNLNADMLDGSHASAFGAVAGNLSQFAATTSAQLASVISDETGSGALCFATSPTLVTPALGTPSSGTLTSCTGLPIVAGTTGTLSIARGGTGATSFTSGYLPQYDGSTLVDSPFRVAGSDVIAYGINIKIDNNKRYMAADSGGSYHSLLFINGSDQVEMRGAGSGWKFANSSAFTLASLSNAGIFLVQNTTTTTGVSKFEVKAGAGQSTNHLLALRDSSNTVVVDMYNDGSANFAGDVAISGDIQFGTHTAIAAETVTGYITIKDSGGTSRKMAVVS